jgi:hypothetical protein
VRWLPYVLALSVSDHSLLKWAGYASLFLSIAAVLWSKLAEFVRRVYVDARDAIRELRRFSDELRR